jgi:hypothetical protein
MHLKLLMHDKPAFIFKDKPVIFKKYIGQNRHEFQCHRKRPIQQASGQF